MWPEKIITDERGSSDALADAFYTTTTIEPEDIEIWNGTTWTSIDNWNMVDPLISFDVEPYEDEYSGETINLYYFKNDNPLQPK